MSEGAISGRLRVLGIEDSARDARLIERTLRKEWSALVYRCVDTPPATLSALTDGSWDVILWDYKIPNFPAAKALELFHTQDRDTPVILVSGAVSTRDAVAAMRAGVREFVSKDQLDLLIPAVERELAAARRRREHASMVEYLRVGEARVQAINATTPDAIIVADAQGNIAEWNPAARKLFGYTRNEAIGQPLTLIIPERLRDAHRAAWRGATEAGRIQRLRGATEVVALRKDGTEFPVELTLAMWRAGGQVSGIIRDISERKRAEVRLRQSDAMLQEVVNTIPDILYRLKLPEAEMVYLSPAVHRLLGFTPEEISSTPGRWLTQIHAEDRARVPRERAAAVRGGGEYLLSYRVWNKTRSAARWFEEHGHGLRTSDGRLSGAFGVLSDVTERKEIEARLRGSLVDTIAALSRTVEARDPYTAGHQGQVATLAMAIGRELRLPAITIEGLEMGGLVHDIGKLSIPVEILCKPTRLTKAEFNLVKLHPQLGYDIVKDVDLPWPVADMLLQHHERLDGSGYPRGLEADGIRLEAKILAVADVMDAIIADRPYRPGLGVGAAFDEVSRNRERLYDTAIVDACIRLRKEGRFRFDHLGTRKPDAG